jgi:hypothetical protein
MVHPAHRGHDPLPRNSRRNSPTHPPG